jgi:hypothetical protein
MALVNGFRIEVRQAGGSAWTLSTYDERVGWVDVAKGNASSRIAALAEAHVEVLRRDARESADVTVAAKMVAGK